MLTMDCETGFFSSIGEVTHTAVKGISHSKKAAVNFNVGLVYRGNMWLPMN